MKRRELLGMLGAAPLAGASARLLATPAHRDARLLVVFLRGAYDCANLLVPTASDFYRAARPRIAVPRPGEAGGAIALDGTWGLHPALASSVLPLFRRGQAAFIPFAGTDDRVAPGRLAHLLGEAGQATPQFVEAAGGEQRRIDQCGPIGRSDNHD